MIRPLGLRRAAATAKGWKAVSNQARTSRCRLPSMAAGSQTRFQAAPCGRPAARRGRDCRKGAQAARKIVVPPSPAGRPQAGRLQGRPAPGTGRVGAGQTGQADGAGAGQTGPGCFPRKAGVTGRRAV